MKRLFRRAVTGLLLGGIVVLGGGFASADYTDGDNPAKAASTITYTVASFRAIELKDPTVTFGTIRQGQIADLAGPTILYGTTWNGDKISVYLTQEMADSVKLIIVPGAPSTPGDLAGGNQCISPGVVPTASVTVTTTSSVAPQPIITGIIDCGYPEISPTLAPTPSYPGGAPVLSETGTTWAYASTRIFIDTRSASDAGTLSTPQSKTLYFVISD